MEVGSVIVIVIGNGIDDSSSNPGQGYLHFNLPRENLLSPFCERIIRQTVFLNFGSATSQVEYTLCKKKKLDYVSQPSRDRDVGYIHT